MVVYYVIHYYYRLFYPSCLLQEGFFSAPYVAAFERTIQLRPLIGIYDNFLHLNR